jgi:phosphoglycerate dehydrogenase-like enzyme
MGQETTSDWMLTAAAPGAHCSKGSGRMNKGHWAAAPKARRSMPARMLNAMKRHAYLINVARGAVLDEPALLEALRTDRIAGAVLDVFAAEPLPGNHPFWSLPNVIVTPHASGRSPTLLQRSVDLFADNVRVYPDRRLMTNVIDLRHGY